MQKSFFFQLIEQHDSYHEKQITNRRFKYEQILPFIESLQLDKRFKTTKVGNSYLDKPLYKIEWGNGSKVVLMWSQMHGNEPTATKAFLDIWKFLSADDHFNDLRNQFFEQLKLVFIPVLNPDGTNLFQRRTFQGIDMNRDAIKLQTPEARILKNLIFEYKAEFGFNLHDQSPFYSAGNTSFPAVISFLAPAFNEIKEINDIREKAMKMIALMNKDLQVLLPNHIGKYDDTYNQRAFGDNIQKWGISTILIESGGYHHDPDKEYIRKLNFALLLRCFEAICSEEYTTFSIEEYNSIPYNVKDNFCDLIIRNAVYEKNGVSYKIDIAVNRNEVEYNSHRNYYFESKIIDIGDLSQLNGYEEIDANGMQITRGKPYPHIFSDHNEAKNADFEKILKNGYTSIEIEEQASFEKYTHLPINMKQGGTEEEPIDMDYSADFLLVEEKEVINTIVNGFVINYQKDNFGVLNGLVY